MREATWLGHAASLCGGDELVRMLLGRAVEEVFWRIPVV